MKKVKVFLLVVGGIVLFLAGGVVAATLTAKDIGFTSSNEEWNVDNVEDAMNDLYDKSKTAVSKVYIPSIQLSSGAGGYTSIYSYSVSKFDTKDYNTFKIGEVSVTGSTLRYISVTGYKTDGTNVVLDDSISSGERNLSYDVSECDTVKVELFGDVGSDSGIILYDIEIEKN